MPAGARDLLLAQPLGMARRYHLHGVPGRDETPRQVGRVVLHPTDPVGRHDARDDADSHAETVEDAKRQACCVRLE